MDILSESEIEAQTNGGAEFSRAPQADTGEESATAPQANIGEAHETEVQTNTGEESATENEAGITFSVKIDARVLYDYLLQHTYNSVAGIFATLAGVFFAIVGAHRGSAIYLIVGIVLILYQPLSLYRKAKLQALTNPTFAQPLEYRMDEKGVTVSQGEAKQFQAWADMYKAVSTGKSLILYTSKLNAHIFPKRDLKDLAPEVSRMIYAHMPAGRVKIRG